VYSQFHQLLEIMIHSQTQVQERFEIVAPGILLVVKDEEGFQVFFSALLHMKADRVGRGLWGSHFVLPGFQVVLRLLNPIPDGLLIHIATPSFRT
jgi:hypothetical protein